MNPVIPVSTLSDIYTSQSHNLYRTGISNWYRLPKNEHQSVLVFTISASQAPIWITAQTILTSLLFMAACELVVLMVLTFYEVGNSGTRRAILVAYYNAGAPSRTIYLMFGYLRKSLFRCTKASGAERIWTIDWSAARASFCLLFIAFSLLSGDLIVKFFFGGTKLVASYAAQANPAAIYYSTFNNTDNGDFTNDTKVIDAVQSLRSAAVFQAVARGTSGADNLRPRITYTEEIIPDGKLLPDGTIQNGTGVRFTYQYNITGYEMGLRDAPGLVFTVNGSCATFHGLNFVRNLSYCFNDSTGQLWEYDSYPFFGDRNLSSIIILKREVLTPPWAEMGIKYSQTDLEENELYRGYTFHLVPHTAWRTSRSNISEDPWYETESNPDPPFYPNSRDFVKYKVKRSCPPLRCTQNDTYTYNGNSVNHVNKLGQLRGLRLLKFIREVVFRREFGAPVLVQLLGYALFGTLVAAMQVITGSMGLGLRQASILTDFQGLVIMSLIYSREVVRNTVLLSPSLNGTNRNLFNAAAINSTVPIEYADFFLESPQVAALSVFVLLTTIGATILLWLLVLIWNQTYEIHSKLDNTSIKAHYILHIYALQAANLYRSLDEALSGGMRKWSGRNTNMPFIRDSDDLRDQRVDSSMAVVSEENAVSLRQKEKSGQESNPETSVDCESEFAEPKLIKVDGDLEAERKSFIDWIWNSIMGRSEPVQYKKQYGVEMSRRWNSRVPRVSWGDIRGIR